MVSPSPLNADLNAAELRRFARHLNLPGVGYEGQRRLKNGSVLIIGAGGLGSPALLYLAAAGVGRLGIVDHDSVSESNLQRQVIFDAADIGKSKADRAAVRVRAINPQAGVEIWREAFTATNARAIAENFDILIDCTDNFPARYLSSDIAFWLKKPNVYGSIHQFEGQTTVFAPHLGAPCYRCMFPVPPAPESVPGCAEGGVLGVLPGLIGTLQATEAVKLLTGAGEPLLGRMLHAEMLGTRFREFKMRRDPQCPVCGENPTITAPVDYDQFCGIVKPEADAEISAAEFEWAKDAAFVLDVREPWEHALMPFPADRWIPWSELENRLDEVPVDRKVIAVCRVGLRSREAARLLRAQGHRGAASLTGGLELLE